MFRRDYDFRSKVWAFEGPTSWRFVSLPGKESAEIKALFGITKRGFGALPVRATIGRTSWKTSIFPDKRKFYVLPLKADVRKQEKIRDGDTVAVAIEVLA